MSPPDMGPLGQSRGPTVSGQCDTSSAVATHPVVGLHHSIPVEEGIRRTNQHHTLHIIRRSIELRVDYTCKQVTLSLVTGRKGVVCHTVVVKESKVSSVES